MSAAHLAGARSITRYLSGLGHRRIGVIAGPHNWLASEARLAGHRRRGKTSVYCRNPSWCAAARQPRSSATTRPANSACRSGDRACRVQREGCHWRAGRRPPNADCAYQKSSPSPASTTSTSLRQAARSSQPCVSHCRRWAASPSVFLSGSWSASGSTHCTLSWPQNWSCATPVARLRQDRPVFHWPASSPTVTSRERFPRGSRRRRAGSRPVCRDETARRKLAAEGFVFLDARIRDGGTGPVLSIERDSAIVGAIGPMEIMPDSRGAAQLLP